MSKADVNGFIVRRNYHFLTLCRCHVLNYKIILSRMFYVVTVGLENNAWNSWRKSDEMLNLNNSQHLPRTGISLCDGNLLFPHALHP